MRALIERIEELAIDNDRLRNANKQQQSITADYRRSNEQLNMRLTSVLRQNEILQARNMRTEKQLLDVMAGRTPTMWPEEAKQDVGASTGRMPWEETNRVDVGAIGAIQGQIRPVPTAGYQPSPAEVANAPYNPANALKGDPYERAANLHAAAPVRDTEPLRANQVRRDTRVQRGPSDVEQFARDAGGVPCGGPGGPMAIDRE